MTDEEYYRYYRRASAAWYLLPIFLGIIGGVIMWLALKSELYTTPNPPFVVAA